MKIFSTTPIQDIRLKNPLVHHITNYVTVNDCANITLAIGGSPIMADDPQEVSEITSISNALVINIGTLHERSINSMVLAGKKANELGIPVVFDPVGVGASKFRTQTAQKLLEDIKFSVIRGNISEIRFLAGVESKIKGVDASSDDLEKEKEAQSIAHQIALGYQCTVAITGATDIVSNGRQTMLIHNGCAEMSRITGTGCMLTSLIASFCGSFSNEIFHGTSTALLTMGIAGELAYERTKKLGTGSFRVGLIDEISKMTDDTLLARGDFLEI